MTESELFERFINLELDAMALKEDLKAVRDEAKESGIDKKDISLVSQSAKLHVANAFEEKTAAARELEEKYKELTGYDKEEPEY